MNERLRYESDCELHDREIVFDCEVNVLWAQLHLAAMVQAVILDLQQ